MEKNLNAGKVANKYNVKISTIHHYDEKGLIEALNS